MSAAPARRAVRYLRVSRADQRPGLQADECGEMIARRGWDLADTFTDQGVSGARDRRPELDRMMAAARRRHFDIVVVWKADRLFRSLKHMVLCLDELAALGVDFVSVGEPFDTTTPSGRLLLHLVAAFAEFERELIRERTRAGLAAARRRGARIGRPRADCDIDVARQLLSDGVPLRRAALQLGVSPATIRRRLGEDADAAVAASPQPEAA